MKNFKWLLLLSAIFMVGCYKPPALPDTPLEQAWDESIVKVQMHVATCTVCQKTLPKDFADSPVDALSGNSQFKPCPQYFDIYRESTRYGDWELYPRGWQWKGLPQKDYVWDYDSQEWDKK